MIYILTLAVSGAKEENTPERLLFWHTILELSFKILSSFSYNIFAICMCLYDTLKTGLKGGGGGAKNDVTFQFLFKSSSKHTMSEGASAL